MGPAATARAGQRARDGTAIEAAPEGLNQRGQGTAQIRVRKAGDPRLSRAGAPRISAASQSTWKRIGNLVHTGTT
jgi:hypothetical protein